MSCLTADTHSTEIASNKVGSLQQAYLESFDQLDDTRYSEQPQQFLYAEQLVHLDDTLAFH